MNAVTPLSVSIAICTRNRVGNFEQAIQSVLRDAIGKACSVLEIFIVDPGQLDDAFFTRFRTATAVKGHNAGYGM
jgi:hypothetical protein